jgi:rRNA small subunit pseudouridine methyltransferase Nep1
MIDLILVDAELETLPKRQGKKGKLKEALSVEKVGILDSTLHQPLMKGLPEAERRGRPDLAFTFMYLCQRYARQHQGRVRVFVHTRHDRVIRIEGLAGVPENIISFLVLMTQLFEKKTLGTPGGSYRLYEGVDLKTLLAQLEPDLIVALSPNGEDVDLKTELEAHEGQEVAVLLGGFPEGDYKSPVYELADVVVSLGPQLLSVPEVTDKVLDSLPKTAK